MSKLIYLRYHILTSKPVDNKEEFIFTGLRNDATIRNQNSIFKFFNSEPIDLLDTRFITGLLVKYNALDYDETVDDASQTIKQIDVKNKIIAKSRYILDINSSILMFFEIPNQIGKSIFMKRFSELFEQNHNEFMVEFSLTSIKEPYSFIDKVKTLKEIKKISIMLYPSNPHYADRWEKMDKRLKENNITKYKETQENNKIEGTLKVDEETEDKFLMSEDGYGDSSAIGTDIDGRTVSISTKDRGKTVSSITKESQDDVPSVLGSIKNKFLEIIKRTGNETT